MDWASAVIVMRSRAMNSASVMPADYADRVIPRKREFRATGLVVAARAAQPAAMREPTPGLHCFLKAWRKSRKLTLEKLAAAIGSKVSTLSGWELGTRAVDLKDLERLASFYGVPPAALLEAPPGSEALERLRRAAEVLRSMAPDAADDWLRMGERLTPADKKSA